MAKPSFPTDEKNLLRGTGPQGHRMRMRHRVLSNGAEGLADYEVLEMLLYYSIPRRDTKPLAKALLHRFGSLAAVFAAPGPELRAAGVTDQALLLVKFPPVVAERLALAEERLRPILGSWDQLCAYLSAAMTSAVPGQFRLLYLDNRNRLLADEPVDDFASTAPIFRRALALQAVALIGIQKTLSGLNSAAAPLRLFARRLEGETPRLSMRLHDVVVVSDRRAPLSLRQKGLF
ncbi:JAB domain-containing protein [Asaia krungthepensis]|uniref:DNA repair protein RadC n=1 Tax=Asaia krungthepensis NRIC 0535 TaxID=1307925 RepID=A0ABQ0Q4Z5_9PROT|nr:JAB domain-containing protein [Asaia krungthepensis]GBQ91621.1 DNA repair protein RadC [Asaia krungthepensis NRIC 0535]